MPTSTLATQVHVLASNNQGGPRRSIRSKRRPGSNCRTSVTIRYNALRALVLTCKIALGPLALAQPAPGSIVTSKIPFTTLLSDSAGISTSHGEVEAFHNGAHMASQGSPVAARQLRQAQVQLVLTEHTIRAEKPACRKVPWPNSWKPADRPQPIPGDNSPSIQ